MSDTIDTLKARFQQYPRLYSPLSALKQRIVQRNILTYRRECVRRIQILEREVQAREAKFAGVGERPILFVVGSQHTNFFSIGGAIGLLSSFALRLSGQRVLYYVCKRGVSQCLRPDRRTDVPKPPCDPCISFRNSIYPLRHTIELKADPRRLQSLRSELAGLPWAQLSNYSRCDLNLGQLCLPSLRWIERRFNLEPNEFRRFMLAEYIVSAIHLAEEFPQVLEELQPTAVVFFNGTTQPEATLVQIARKYGVKIVSYEVGLNGISAFFSHGIAPEYAISVQPAFELGPMENQKLDSYLASRFKQGNFTQFGVKFWSSIKPLPTEILEETKKYRQVVSVFTNVTWDTSQAYAHIFFKDMFDWLESTLRAAINHPDTLFVVRAHPHDLRPGRVSNEPVAEWLGNRGYLTLPNLIFIPPNSEISSYELISISKFCVVYNSTIALEAIMMGKVVLCGGWSHYRNASVSYNIASKNDFCGKLKEWLEAESAPIVEHDHLARARRFFYFSLFKASLDFSSYVEPVTVAEFIPKPVDIDALTPERSPEMRVIVDGILNGDEFYYT